MHVIIRGYVRKSANYVRSYTNCGNWSNGTMKVIAYDRSLGG